MSDGDGTPSVLAYQLDFLKLEFEAVNQAIRRIDETTQGTKNWGVIVWAGSVWLALSAPELRPYLLVTAATPLPFWFVDAYWRHVQRTFIFRNQVISDFLNGPGLAASFESGRLQGLWLLDPRAEKVKETESYRRFTRLRHTWRYQEVGPFYGGLVLISILIAALAPR